MNEKTKNIPPVSGVKSATRKSDDSGASAYQGKLDDLSPAKTKSAKSNPVPTSRMAARGNTPSQVGRHSQRHQTKRLQQYQYLLDNNDDEDDDYTQNKRQKISDDLNNGEFSHQGDDALNYDDELSVTEQEQNHSVLSIHGGSDFSRHRNRHIMQFFQSFLDNISPTQTEKQKLMLILQQMFQQCIDGLRHFPPTTRQHHGFGRSSNICKQALSALSRDDIVGAKKMLQIITPKR